MRKLIGCCSIVGLGMGAGLSLPGFAQSYPAQPIRLIVGFQAGGATDIAARAIGKKLTESLGQSVIVDNRAGAAGNIAADIVAKAPADGYALLMANATIAIPSLYAKLPFDVNKDLLPISLIAIGPSLLAVNPSLPVNNVIDLITLAKVKPKQLLYGSGGLGNSTHLAMELFTSMAEIEMVHVPYKGGAPSVIGLMSGEVQILFTSIPSVLAQVNAGKVKALGVSTLHRSSALPNVPTIDEAGLTGYSAASWYGLFAPAGVPQNALAILSREIVKIMRIQDVRERFLSDGFDPVGNEPEEFSRFIQEEIPKWAKVVKMAGIKPQ